jgi:hypothetical protein
MVPQTEEAALTSETRPTRSRVVYALDNNVDVASSYDPCRSVAERVHLGGHSDR